MIAIADVRRTPPTPITDQRSHPGCLLPVYDADVRA